MMLDHACKLSPQGRITFSRGTKAAAYCLSPLSSCSVLSSLQAPVVFSLRSHMDRRFEPDRELNHICASMDVMASHGGTNRWISD